MKKFCLLFGAFFSLVLFGDLKTTFEKTDLLISFQGKGTSVSYDVGVIEESQRFFPQLRDQNNRVILTGNSSGAIPVIYFSCHGFDAQTMAKFRDLFLTKDTPIWRALRELRDSESPAKKLAHFTLKGIPEMGLDNLNPYLAAAVGIDSYRSGAVNFSLSSCRPKIPFVIVAANQDVLENRKDPKKFSLDLTSVVKRQISDELLKGRGHKQIDYRNFAVSWTKNAFQYFKSEKKEHKNLYPHLELGEEPYIGRACTYFADRVASDLLKQLPEEERLCDIRTVEKPEELALAIQASSAEPSYFGLVPENDHSRLSLTRMPPTYSNRQYWGGFIMTLVAQDIRRLLPRVKVMGTGLARLDMANEGRFIKAVSLAEADKIAQYSEYWADFVIPMRGETKTKIRSRTLSTIEEYELGRAEANKCFKAELAGDESKNQCRAVGVMSSKEVLAHASEAALTYSEDERQLVESKTALPRARGLKDLLAEEPSL